MRKILVPCDFSKQSVDAFRFALGISEKSNGEVHLLNVVELPILHDSVLMPVLSYEVVLLKELKDKAISRFAKITDKYSHKKVTVKSKVIFGATSRMIQDYIKKNKIDLVVMGTQGASGLKEYTIGSNTEKIVRNVEVPVLAIKKYSKPGSIRSIVFPSDLTEHDNVKGIVSRIKDLQHFFKAVVHIVKINTPASFSQDVITDKKLKDFVTKYGLKNCTVNTFNDLYEETGIINFAHKVKAGMIAMGTHGRKGLVHALSGSLAEDVVNHIDIPIWTYKLTKK